MSEIYDGKLVKDIGQTPPDNRNCLNASQNTKEEPDETPKKVEPDYGYEFLYW